MCEWDHRNCESIFGFFRFFGWQLDDDKFRRLSYAVIQDVASLTHLW